MVIALLACLGATVATGLIAYGEQGKGPLADRSSLLIVAHSNGNEAEHAARPEGTASVVGELHGVLANITLGLIVLHIVGVGLASTVHRENLVVSMISGRKRAEQAVDPP